MAKRPRNVGSAQSQFDRVLATIPSRAEFELTMAANSTTEVWTDIDTNLDDGEAWLVYGGEFIFESIATPAVFVPVEWIAQDNVYCLQVHRNDDSELPLNFNDDDLMFEWRAYEHNIATAAGTSDWIMVAPFKFGHRTITFSEKLRILFRTYADDVGISDATLQIAGRLYYDRIKAPSIGQSKLGQIADL